MQTIFRRLLSQKAHFESIPLTSVFGRNEPLFEYKKGSMERKELEEVLSRMAGECPEIPLCIGSGKFTVTEKFQQTMPHRFAKTIAKYCYSSRTHMNQAISEAMKIQEEWRRVNIEEKHKIWHRAADLFAGKYRQELNSAIMLGQAKTVIQAEIDTAELIDFLRFGADYLVELAKFTPISPNPKVSLNTYHLRPLDGFVAAITPFNFTAIGLNLAFTPCLLGNVTLWKPSETAILSNWIAYKVMLEAGVPPGVVSFLPSKKEDFGEVVTQSPYFAGLNFTGSVATFRKLWMMISSNLHKYNCFPRMVGECGGKNFHFVHPSADVSTVLTATMRSAFEYSGQKCSACSRLYVPESLWGSISAQLKKAVASIKIGDVSDFSVFTSAVIDEMAFDRIAKYLKSVGSNPSLEIIAGGGHCRIDGYFINPTVIRTKDPFDSLMTDEIFGPVLTVYVYKDSEVNSALSLVNKSNYALTGAIFAKDKKFILHAVETLKMSAGNFYINDKCTGSVVGQQPFGGSKLSGTNDKAGSPHYLLRWASPQVIKETFVPLRDIEYQYMK